nr:MAG TPA: hypothetical protein [Caudoviricetes sp.]
MNSIIHLFLYFNPSLPKPTSHYQVLPTQQSIMRSVKSKQRVLAT